MSWVSVLAARDDSEPQAVSDGFIALVAGKRSIPRLRVRQISEPEQPQAEESGGNFMAVTIVITAIIVIVIGLLAVGGWWFWRRRRQAQAAQKTQLVGAPSMSSLEEAYPRTAAASETGTITPWVPFQESQVPAEPPLPIMPQSIVHPYKSAQPEWQSQSKRTSDPPFFINPNPVSMSSQPTYEVNTTGWAVPQAVESKTPEYISPVGSSGSQPRVPPPRYKTIDDTGNATGYSRAPAPPLPTVPKALLPGGVPVNRPEKW